LFKICKALRHCVSRTHGLLVLKRTRWPLCHAHLYACFVRCRSRLKKTVLL
jgi:hypothetical protein